MSGTPSSGIPRPTTPSAALSRLRQLLQELRLLTAAFPDLRDAVDADELPIRFILKRDSGRAEDAAGRRQHSPDE